MNRLKFFILMTLLVVMSILPCGIGQRDAQALIVGPNGYYIPDYFTTPNWANSPPLAKFIDTLAPLGCTTPNTIGQCIPIAVADTTTYPGSDYYEIELVQYREQLHSDLPPVTLGGNPAVGVQKMDPAAIGGTKLRGYRQTNGGPALLVPHYLGPLIIASKYDPSLPAGVGGNGKPVRIKFTNSLSNGSGGNLFVPVDTTIMGSGDYTINYNPVTKAPADTVSGTFPQNRATLHLHGGRTPWISDGTAHQWITPSSEPQGYGKGVSVQYVPDMWFVSGATVAACAGKTTCATVGASNNPGPGSQTFYWTNQQSARLLFYHDHAWGITRLNVYAGEAAGYLIQDPVEKALVSGGTVNGRTFAAGTIPADQIPLVIQDKTFVNATLGDPAAYTMATDPTWAWGSVPRKPALLPGDVKTGDLWWPHVYMPAQNPYNPDYSGTNAMGRWHYGPWFFPPTPVCGSTPAAVKPFCIETGVVANPYYPPGPNQLPNQPPEMPGTPQPSWGAEAFLDTMMVNGTVYPTLQVQPQKYRLRILNASHDRFLNLQLYQATPGVVTNLTLTAPGSGYYENPQVTFTGTGTGATATATVDLNDSSPTFGQIIAINLDTVGSGYTGAVSVVIAGGGGTGATATAATYTAPTEVGMVPAAQTSGFPSGWPADGREGGVPYPALRGPAFIQIGSEGGFLPAPVVLPNRPVKWNTDPTMFNVGNVLQQYDGGGTLFLGPAERADIIVDFTKFGGKTLILYNDAPTAFPALDPHYDYYTGAPDRTDIGGYIAVPPGVGPNIRTVMQITVAAGGPQTAPVNDYDSATLTALKNAFKSDTTTHGAFASSQDGIVVGQAAYGTGTGNTSAYNMVFPATWPNWGVARISDGAISFMKLDGTVMSNYVMKPKAMHDEMGATFDDYGRMSAKLGLEAPFVNGAIANFILQNFVDPVTEIVRANEIQIWRITHNGVDTHPIHFHLFDVQVLNRVGWDGFIRLPDLNELGWKDTVRVSPLEDTIVALRPVKPQVPFAQPNSVRPLNPSQPLGSDIGFSQIDPVTGNAAVPAQTNQMVNFGHEYTWHCHILSHEENDMMRPIIFDPNPLSTLYAVFNGFGVWQWEAGAWTQINPTDPASMVTAGSTLYATFTGYGLYRWDGTAWTQINPSVPASMVASGSMLYATFTGYGLYRWDGTAWTRINPTVPASMVASDSMLFAAFTGSGLYTWNGTAWTQIYPTVPASMVTSGSTLYAAFTGNGLSRWDGAAWTQINPTVPASMVTSGSTLYATFTGYGLNAWYGTAWTQINPTIPASMVTSGTTLYAAFTGSGLYTWNGTVWTRINETVPLSMIVSDSILYANFTGYGLWTWEGNVWSPINPTTAANMVVGF
jgi:FtsP/CotA-like multicopper oxidase with cupredoxin domain